MPLCSCYFAPAKESVSTLDSDRFPIPFSTSLFPPSSPSPGHQAVPFPTLNPLHQHITNIQSKQFTKVPRPDQ